MKCTNCSKPITGYRPPKQNKSDSRFCSQSCAAVYNNKVYVKRKRLRSCKTCSTFVTSGFTYCHSCWKTRDQLLTRTLQEAIGKYTHSNRYGVVRQHARRVYKYNDKPQYCIGCGYSKHFQVCHIKAISEFTRDTLLGVVNHPDNLIALCPNCHWEFDHGLLGTLRFERR